jgi:hypothetical protein
MIERDPLPSDQSSISSMPVLGTGVPMVGTAVYARIPPAPQFAEEPAPWFALQQRPAGPSRVASDDRHVLIAEASSGSVLVATLPPEAVDQP